MSARKAFSVRRTANGGHIRRMLRLRDSGTWTCPMWAASECGGHTWTDSQWLGNSWAAVSWSDSAWSSAYWG